MATIGSIEARAREFWPNAEIVSVTPAGTGHTSFTDPDPKGYRLGVSGDGGKVISLLNAETLDELDDKLTELIETKR